jgi:hypothetical protein
LRDAAAFNAAASSGTACTHHQGKCVRRWSTNLQQTDENHQRDGEGACRQRRGSEDEDLAVLVAPLRMQAHAPTTMPKVQGALLDVSGPRMHSCASSATNCVTEVTPASWIAIMHIRAMDVPTCRQIRRALLVRDATKVPCYAHTDASHLQHGQQSNDARRRSLRHPVRRLERVGAVVWLLRTSNNVSHPVYAGFAAGGSWSAVMGRRLGAGDLMHHNV